MRKRRNKGGTREEFLKAGDAFLNYMLKKQKKYKRK